MSNETTVCNKTGTHVWERAKSTVFNLAQEVFRSIEEEECNHKSTMKNSEELGAEAENSLKIPVEGQLFKYTNVMKGWQFRWFVLTPETGMLEYYMLEERKKHRPRGAIHLTDAVVVPSEEDQQSFTVSAVCGEVYKLKASDAKERKVWVDRIRETSKSCSVQALVYSKGDTTNVPYGSPVKSVFHLPHNAVEANTADPSTPVTKSEKIADSLAEIKTCVSTAVKCQKELANSIEDLPYTGNSFKCSDRDLLLLKAASQAAVQSLEQCYLILRRRQREALQRSGLAIGTTADMFDKCKSPTMKMGAKKVDIAVKNV